eukprot:CAMPEP_0172158902 /NCGR_PEP_ID=MMETSP1050-20130122/4648_1 /TAXON_ID=233186 /ORGANISM="Cryptomonas curvata, Strain CCAP979/52" /LENGTH=527 /DNA_ID=CAMNT_0012828381 /DNA_START=295 /DNA_END=1879 /DNA_ORIENTATION=+
MSETRTCSRDQRSIEKGLQAVEASQMDKPRSAVELKEINIKLRALQSEFPEISSLSLEVFCQQLSLFRSGSSGSDLQLESSDEEEPLEQPCEMATGSQLAHALPPSNFQEANLSGFKCFEASNQDPRLSTGSHRTQSRLVPVASEHDDSAPDSLHENFQAIMFDLFSIVNSAEDTADKSSLDELLHNGLLGPHNTAAMDIDAGDSTLVASTRAALAPARAARDFHDFRQSRAGLLSSGIPIVAIPWPQLRERRCIRFLDPATRGEPKYRDCPRWAWPMLYRLHQCGFRERDVASEYMGLSADLGRAVQLATCSMIVLMQANYARAGCRWLLGRVGFHGHTYTEPPPWVYRGVAVPRSEGGDDADGDAAPLDQSHVGLSRFTLQAQGGVKMRLVEYHCNPAYVQMTGFPVEELLARVGCSDVPLPFCELDHICLIIDLMWSRFEPRTSHCMRWAWPGASHGEDVLGSRLAHGMAVLHVDGDQAWVEPVRSVAGARAAWRGLRAASAHAQFKSERHFPFCDAEELKVEH